MSTDTVVQASKLFAHRHNYSFQNLKIYENIEQYVAV